MKRKETEILGAQVPKEWIDIPNNVKVEFSFWQLLDELGSWFLQGAAVVGGGPYTPTLNPITGSINIASSGIKIYFPMFGAEIDVIGSVSIDVPSGDHVIVVPEIEYPIIDASKIYQVVAPDKVRDFGQFCVFLGGRKGNTIYMRPDSALSV
jgi:hypothetical protein